MLIYLADYIGLDLIILVYVSVEIQDQSLARASILGEGAGDRPAPHQIF